MHSPRLVNATTHAIELALGTEAPDEDRALRDAMQRLCAEARRLNVRPEELIVLFKMTWRSHPELRARQRSDGSSVLEQVVSMCIQEYYRSSVA